MWKRVLSFNFTLTLFREETIDVFKVAEVQFEKVKNVKKIVKEMEQQATSTKTGAADIHRERRRYLRGVLKEATTLFHDQPGLLGNKKSEIIVIKFFIKNIRKSLESPDSKDPKELKFFSDFDQKFFEILRYDVIQLSKVLFLKIMLTLDKND